MPVRLAMRQPRFPLASKVRSQFTGARRIAVQLGCVALASTPVYAEENVPPPSVATSIGQEVRAVYEKCRHAVVKIEATDEHGDLSGTGFFIDPNGTLYTSYTIGGESHDIAVICDGERYEEVERLVA